jgi:FlaA1/EpsC-like NDP-sugar epimerase
MAMPGRFNWRNGVAFAHDVAAAGAAWVAAFMLRFNFEVEEPFYGAMWRNLVWLLPAQALFFWRVGMYRGLWRYASLPDLQRIVLAAALGALAIALVVLLFKVAFVPRSIVVLYPMLLGGLMGGSRIVYRAWKEGRLTPQRGPASKRVLILGAGEAAAMLLKSLDRHPDWEFVGLLDDNRAKLAREIHGVPVLGTLDQLAEVARRTEAELAVVAMPGLPHAVRRRAVDLAAEAGLPAMTVPSYDDLVSGKVTVSQLRRIELDDLLGRDPVELDSAALHGWLDGRVVLVTGAGGSIGSELVRQILKFDPACVVLLDASELALYNMEQEFGGAARATRLVYAIGDVKTGARIAEVMREHRPSVVFHAAAYKHVPLMEERNAWQAVANNTLGTWRVAEAAMRHGVEKFVLVSTDKAVNPTNVMGASKRLAEMVVQAMSSDTTRFVTVRFGNVLGSTGSVIPKFRRQIAAGGPLTVTHPDIRRFFMSIPEAAQLVLQAGLMGRGGEILVLDMGEPVRIVDLARDLIRLSGLSERDIRIEFTGLRPGEKLYEEILADNERTLPTPHPKLRVMKPEVPQARAWVGEVVAWLEQEEVRGDEETRAGLAARIPEYQPAGSMATRAASTSQAANA